MKYRRLTKEELEPLAEDFAIFLATNSIDKKQWDEMKVNEPEKAEQTLDIFSDMVFEKALKSARFLQRISETEIQCYSFHLTQAHMISAKLEDISHGDFLSGRITEVLQAALSNQMLELKQGTKKYTLNREEELFEILQTGAVLSKGELYQSLLGLL